MIKLINILKEIKVFKHLRPISTMYDNVKPIMAEYINSYDVTGVKGDAPLIDVLDDGGLQNNLAYDLAKYDGDMDGLNNDDASFYYNSLAFTFLIKYGLETGLIKFPFTGDEVFNLDDTYNNGDMFNNPDLKEMEKYRGQF
jgi:hypothetical protein